ncbi:unnamed protein product, partial [Closterium sp. NIES-53]
PPSLLSLHLYRPDWLTPQGAQFLPVPPLFSRVLHWSGSLSALHLPSFSNNLVSASGPVAPPCSCRLLSHQTLLWHHCFGISPCHAFVACTPASLFLVFLGLCLPSRPRLPRPAFLASRGGSAPLLTPRRFPRRLLPCRLSTWSYGAQTAKGEVPDVLIPWIRAVRLQLRERFREDLLVLRLHSDRGGEFSSDLLRDFCRGEGILQSFTLLASPHQNGIAEHQIGLIMEVARTSMIHAVAPHFLWPFAARYDAHQLNLWPRVSLPETSPTLHWTGKVGDASVFRVWGSRACVRDTSADKLSSRAIPCVFLGFPPDEPGWQFFLPYLVPCPSLSRRHVDPLPETVPVEVAVDSGATGGTASGVATSGGAEPASVEPGGSEPAGAEPRGAESEGAESRGAEHGGAEPGDTEPEGAELGGAESEGAESGGAAPKGTAYCTCLKSGAVGAGGSAAGGTGVGGAGATCLGGAGVPAGAGGTGGAGAAGRGGACTRSAVADGAGGVGGVGAGGARVGDPGTRGAGAGRAGAGDPGVLALGVLELAVLVLEALCSNDRFLFRRRRHLCRHLTRSFARFLPELQPDSPLPAPSPYPEQTDSFTKRREPESRPASPVRAVRTGRHVPRPRPPPVPSTHAMALLPSSLPLRVPLPPPPASSLPAIPDPESDLARAASPTVPRLLATAVTDPSFESTAASALVAKLLEFAATCRLDYATALVAESESASPPSVAGECALGMDVLEDRQEDFECLAAAVPHLMAMLLSPEGDPDAPDIPTPRSYAEAITGPYSSHSQTAMDAEMTSWKSTGTYFDAVPLYGANIVDGMRIFRHSFPAGQPARGDLAAPPTRLYWVVSCRTTLAALGFAPSNADPSLFLHTDTMLPPFYVLVYVDDLVFAIADTEALTLLKSALQKRHTCTDLEPSGPYPKLVGCLMYLMTCTRPDLAYPLSILTRYVVPGRHRPEHWDAAKRVLCYLCSTSGMGLGLGGRGPVVLTGHANASWVDDLATQLTSQGYTFSLGSCSVSWRSTRSYSVLSSSCEAEIYAGAMAAQELRLLTYLLIDLVERPRSSPQRGQLRLAYVATRANTADIFTKALQSEPLGAVLTMAGSEERGGRGAGGSGEAQAQGQPRDSAMAPVQPSLGPPRDEPRVFGLDKFNGDNFAEWSFKMENIFDHYDLLKVMEGTENRPENDPEKSPWVRKSAQGYLLLGQALGSSQIRHIKPFQREPEKGPKA